MKEYAIALCRISSAKQIDGHSLEAQEQSVRNMANELSAEIVKIWSITQSSRAGKNKQRRDLTEIKDYCRKNKGVKYLLVDRVSRLMREWKLMLIYTFELEDLGVKVIYCDPSQRHLNNEDQLAQLLTIIEGFKSEQENKERGETTIARMKARYNDGYYLSHPHAGYMKSNTPGLHIPDPERFDLLQKSGHLIIYNQYTVVQAVAWLNDSGYRTSGGNRLDLNHYSDFIIDPYYCGRIHIKSDDWPKDVAGLHTPMFSKREHALLVSAITKRNPRKRYKNNPSFPLANILRHYECRHTVNSDKFSGYLRNPGKQNGKQRNARPVYDCRNCRKRIASAKLHDGISEYLGRLELLPSQPAFRQALVKIWRNQRGSMVQRLNSLQANKKRFEVDLKSMAIKYASEPEGVAKDTFRLLLEDYKAQLDVVDIQIHEAKNTEMASEEFINFALSFVSNLRDNWLKLSYEDAQRGVQVLFNGKIYADNNANVRPLKLSTVYGLGSNKKALSGIDNAHLVELAGTAPASDW